VLMIDVDHFKVYNDRHGHMAGDNALRGVSKILQHGRRANDVVARYGGEELIAILVDSRRDDAAAVADSMRRAVAELGIAHAASITRPYVTVSIGVTTIEPGGDYSHERAVRLADLALYATKAQGRDGWSFQSPEDGAADGAVARDALEERAATGLMKTAS